MNEYEEMQDEEAEVTEVAETETEGEVEQDEAEFTDTGAEETEVAEPSSDSEEDANAETDSKSEAKSERDDTFQAEKRRQREEKEAAIRKRIEEEAYRKGIIEAVGGVNPYNGEAIKDKADVDEYLIMKELDKQGKDPIADYAKAVKEKQKAQVETERTEKNRAQELSEFAEKYPTVNVTELLKNERFCKFAGQRVKHESLATVYGDYLTFTDEFNVTVDKKAQIKAKATAAKAKASPGSLTGNGSNPPQKTYENMSDAEFEKMIAKAKSGALKKI